ncbi:hypothetical protein AeRB84_012818 [Aphanomyces euteiches]|nr:hypothetical protein AeRB84_012818 [Aphanomyces euteiches]
MSERQTHSASPVIRKVSTPHSASYTRKASQNHAEPTDRMQPSLPISRPSSSNSNSATPRDTVSTAQKTPQCDTNNENQVGDVDDDEDVLATDYSFDIQSSVETPASSLGTFAVPYTVQVELQRVNQLNESLKMEVARLQESLVQRHDCFIFASSYLCCRLRGNSKFVGGGQFRSMVHNSAPPSPKVTGCSNCFNSRAALKKAKSDLKNVKPMMDELQVKLSESLVARRQMNDTIAHKETTEFKLKEELAAAKKLNEEQSRELNQLRVELESAHRPPSSSDADETYKNYRAQLDLCNEKTKQVQMLTGELQQVQNKFENSLLLEENLRKRVEQMTESLKSSEQSVADLRLELEQYKLMLKQNQKDLEAIKVANEREIAELKNEVEKWRALAASYREKLQAFETEQQSLMERLRLADLERSQHSQAVQDMQKETHHLQLLRRKSCGDVADLTQKYDNLSQQYATLLAEKEILLQDRAANETNVEKATNELKLCQQQLTALEQDILSKRCEKNALESQLDKLTTENSALTQRATEAETRLQEQSEKLVASQNQALKQRGQVHTLQSELKTCKHMNEDLNYKLVDLQQTHTKALEKAMQSLVRLCVVAPTVNVHLSGQILPCKSTLPKDAIRTIVQNDILPVFSSIFLQQEEGTSPTGTSLDAWLQSLLKEMQTSIEKHLKSLFQA